jgi:hypothetical protein
MPSSLPSTSASNKSAGVSEEIVAVRKYLDLPHNEQLFGSFSCSLWDSMMYHKGTLYVCQNFLGFVGLFGVQVHL